MTTEIQELLNHPKLLAPRKSKTLRASLQPYSLRGMIKRISLFRARAQQRRQLARLDARQLRDMGISPEQAFKESQKAFWEK